MNILRFVTLFLSIPLIVICMITFFFNRALFLHQRVSSIQIIKGILSYVWLIKLVKLIPLIVDCKLSLQSKNFVNKCVHTLNNFLAGIINVWKISKLDTWENQVYFYSSVGFSLNWNSRVDSLFWHLPKVI